MAGYLLLTIIAFSLVAYFVGRATGRSFVTAETGKVHSLPGYHGAFVAVWVGIPAFLLVLLWLALQGQVIDRLLIAMLPADLTGSCEGRTAADNQTVRNLSLIHI